MVLDFLLEFLKTHELNPVLYLLLLFTYSFLAAIVLPIPVELGLVFNPGMHIALKAVTVGGGKALGALAVFHLGLRVEDHIRAWSTKYPLVEKLVDYGIKFVKATGYAGLFLILIIPFMSDTAAIYIYSIFNKEGQIFASRFFLLVNFLAGITRASIFLAILRPAGLA